MSNGNDTHNRPGAAFFTKPATAAQRQYEALRAYLVEGLSAKEAADRFGYSEATLYSLCRELRAGRLRFFQPLKPGPKHAPKREAAKDQVVQLRKQNYSIYDIQKMLPKEVALSHVAIHKILRQEGFTKLPRRPAQERAVVPRPDVADVADVRELDWEKFSNIETEGGGLFVFLPTIVNWGIAGWVRKAKFPGSRMIPALQSILSLLSLKLTGKERISHVMDVCADPGFALFATMNALPKTTALSTYSYRTTRSMTASLLHSYTSCLIRQGLLPGKSFNLDFHAIPYRGNDEVAIQKHYMTRHSRRERSVLAFLVQDGDSHALCYANATVRKEDQSEEILRFIDFWKETRGKLPPHLVFDSQLTSYPVLNRIDQRGIRFITLRRRGTVILRELRQLPESQWKKMELGGVSRQYSKVAYVEQRISVAEVEHELRQIAVRGLGHEHPTLLLTNDWQRKPVEVVERYAHRMLIENGISENVDFFHMDALCSAIAIQVDLDLMLTLTANALYRNLAKRLVGFETAKPKQIFRRFLNTPARISVDRREVRVRLRRCAHHPILLASGVLDESVTVPWWQGRRLRVGIR